MGLTTGGPPPSGITWQALIFKQFGLSVDPELRMKNIPDASFGLAVAPSIRMRPPSKFRLKLSPMIAMGGGSDIPAGMDVAVVPRMSFGKVQTTAMRLTVTPHISMNGRDKERGAFALIASPSLGLAALRTVTFDAVGAGGATSGGTNSVFTWSHTIAGNAALLFLNASGSATGNTATAKVGATSMTQLGVLTNFATTNTGGGTDFQCLWVFGLLSPPTGSQTITVTMSGPGDFCVANSVSYNNVSSFGTVVTNTGSGTTASHTVSSSLARRVAQMFGDNCSTSGAFSAYSQTSRYNSPFTSGAHYPIVIGDAAGAASVAFTATQPSSTFGSIAVPLIP